MTTTTTMTPTCAALVVNVRNATPSRRLDLLCNATKDVLVDLAAVLSVSVKPSDRKRDVAGTIIDAVLDDRGLAALDAYNIKRDAEVANLLDAVRAPLEAPAAAEPAAAEPAAAEPAAAEPADLDDYARYADKPAHEEAPAMYGMQPEDVGGKPDEDSMTDEEIDGLAAAEKEAAEDEEHHPGSSVEVSATGLLVGEPAAKPKRPSSSTGKRTYTLLRRSHAFVLRMRDRARKWAASPAAQRDAGLAEKLTALAKSLDDAAGAVCDAKWAAYDLPETFRGYWQPEGKTNVVVGNSVKLKEKARKTFAWLGAEVNGTFPVTAIEGSRVVVDTLMGRVVMQRGQIDPV